eukprot:scaffold1518_cov417-Prasinococcus_capsulatus_cf.AAC.39
MRSTGVSDPFSRPPHNQGAHCTLLGTSLRPWRAPFGNRMRGMHPQQYSVHLRTGARSSEQSPSPSE